MVVSLAMADIHHGGWFGKVVKDGREGTSNVGSIGDKDGRSAGQATNVVTDFARVTGESRSHDPAFATAITAAYRAAFEKAGAAVRDDAGATAKVKFESRLDYTLFKLDENSPVVDHTKAAIRKLGWEPTLRV